MSVLLVLVGLITMAIGVVTLIRPIRALRISDRKRAALVLVSGFVIIVVAGGLLKEYETAGGGASARASSSQAGTVHTKPVPSVPPEQEAFIQAVLWARQAYSDAPNQLAKGGVRAQRRDRIRQALNSMGVSGWLGRIVKLGSNSDGKGVLEVEIAEDILLVTWNNAVSDIGSNTLIDPGSPLFAALAKMKKGQKVRFSGRFFPDETDCVSEQSMSLAGSMREPEFVFRFNDVREQ